MASLRVLIILCLTAVSNASDDLRDFELDSKEMMIAQESRHYQTVVKPPIRIIKPSGVTNSHRPQYNLDSLEADLIDEELDNFFETTTRRNLFKTNNVKKEKEGMIRDAVLRALERKDHVGKFAQILPIIRAMSGNQRVALASLVASQVSTPPGRQPLNLPQVRSMFGNNNNATSDLMLPILLDMANLIRRAVGPGKELREVKTPAQPQAQFLRRSFVEDDDTTLDDNPFEVAADNKTIQTTKAPQVTQRSILQRNRNIRIRPQRNIPTFTKLNTPVDRKTAQDNRITNTTQSITQEKPNEVTVKNDAGDNRNVTRITTTSTEPPASPFKRSRFDSSTKAVDNSTLDLTADATNQTYAQDLPIAEKLRSLNRYIDRKGNLIRRGTYPPKRSPATRRTTAEPTLNPISRRRPIPVRKLPTSPTEQAKCELFTNTLCLHAEDYPTDAIVQSIRRNKAAAGALLADFKDPGEGAVDGITAAQEAKYTAEHYLVSNRRGDTANRDFASAGEAGFMCPSTVKYARPQRARATSGQWKYIVNTGEHTQTLRLEKCLKPKESCTYLTDNFKSKCVQVYNYHRLLTWDQQNGLHMDIFKVPTCCSCHIEGYSVSFPPLGHRIHESSSEQFPGEDLSSEHGNHAFEAVQSTIQRPSVTKSPPFTYNKPLESFSPFADNNPNVIPGSFPNAKLNENDEYENLPPSNPMDSYGNTYFSDSFNQASSIRNVKRPLQARNPPNLNSFDQVTLPSYLEPPTPSAPASFSFSKDTSSKYKLNESFKRGPLRPSRRPIRKKISGVPDDLVSSGTSAVGAFSGDNLETMEDFNDDLEEPDVPKLIPSAPRQTISPKLHAVTTELASTTFKPLEHKSLRQNITSSGKRVNYNYHPIIDFFDDVEKEDESIDREDSEATYVPSIESEWKPINHPASRNTKSSKVTERKRHK
ncbi:neurotrophin 1 isoform X1 [Epargyreus clarus]|uniref:neurotrophin 1 isoform X1 n=1 Tax=Epargyreus clarus TaxID=520877 RepID=UPI003C2CBFC7